MERNSKTIVLVAAFAAFLATFNETFLNVAFTPIMADLGVNVAVVQWLATAYMLGAAVMVPISAFIYRSIPTKPLFLFTVSLLIIGSIIGALANEFSILLIGRIIQAIGTGMLIPIGMNITLEVAPRHKLGIYMGVMGIMTTLGPSLSIIVSGALLSVFNWQILLWFFAGLAVLCWLCAVFLLPNIAKLTHPKLDVPSVALVSIALVGILYGISTAFSGSFLIALITAVIGLFSLGFFLARQKKLTQPLIDLKPLAVRPFAIGVIINMLSLIIIFALNIIIPIFMQSTLQASSLDASLTLFPAILLSCVVAPLAGKIYDRRGAKILLPLGFALIALFAGALAGFRQTESFLLLALLYIPVICGSALIIGPVQSFALSRLEPELNPHGVTVMSTGFQIAGCIGASLFTGVYYAITLSGGGTDQAAGQGFLVVGLLAAVFALVGLFLALYIGKFTPTGIKAVPSQAADLRSIMKTEVYSVPAKATLLNAMQAITEKKVSGMPIVDEQQKVVGFISDGDIIRYLAKSHPLFINAYSLAAINKGGFDQKLQELMSLQVTEVGVKKVITVPVEADLGEVCRILNDRHLKKAPVMEKGKMVGIINRSNITKYALQSGLAVIKN